MHRETSGPSFEEFLSFVAAIHRPSPGVLTPPEPVRAAARVARRELRDSSSIGPAAITDASIDGTCEVLELLAASSRDTARPSELVTARGFRVKLDYRDATDAAPSSLCVLVQCPQRWLAGVQGRMARIWNGTERFELGEFDVEGKALGTLPPGIDVTLDDLAAGRVRLDAPEVPSRD